jgi:hypothetical protein
VGQLILLFVEDGREPGMMGLLVVGGSDGRGVEYLGDLLHHFVSKVVDQHAEVILLVGGEEAGEVCLSTWGAGGAASSASHVVVVLDACKEVYRLVVKGRSGRRERGRNRHETSNQVEARGLEVRVGELPLEAG